MLLISKAESSRHSCSWCCYDEHSNFSEVRSLDLISLFDLERPASQIFTTCVATMYENLRRRSLPFCRYLRKTTGVVQTPPVLARVKPINKKYIFFLTRAPLGGILAPLWFFLNIKRTAARSAAKFSVPFRTSI